MGKVDQEDMEDCRTEKLDNLYLIHLENSKAHSCPENKKVSFTFQNHVDYYFFMCEKIQKKTF